MIRVVEVICKRVASTLSLESNKMTESSDIPFKRESDLSFKMVDNPVEHHFQVDMGQGCEEVARIGPDGIMRFSIEATDENAKKFVKLIEEYFQIRLTGIVVAEKEPNGNQPKPSND